MSLTNTVVRRPTTIIIIYILLTVLALVVYPNLSVELFPEMDLPMVIVYSSYRGQALRLWKAGSPSSSRAPSPMSGV